MKIRDFPGGPVVRIPCFHGRGHVGSFIRKLGSKAKK